MDTLADYERWKTSKQEAGVGAAQAVIGSVEDTPDQAAGDLNLASEFGKVTGNPVPSPSLVKEYRPTFQQAIEREKAKTILTSSPMLTEWLRNPESAAIARDDLNNLSWWETAFGASGNALSRFKQGVDLSANQFMAETTAKRARDRDLGFMGILQDERRTGLTGMDGEELLGFDGSEPLMAGMRWLDAQYANLIGTDDKSAALEYQREVGRIAKRIEDTPMSPAATRFREKAFDDTRRAQPDRVKAYNSAMSDWDGRGAPPEVPEAVSGQEQGWIDTVQFLSDIASDPSGAAAFIYEVALESLPSSAVGIAAGIATRNPAFGATVMGGTSYAQERFREPSEFFKGKGIDLSTIEGAISVISDPELMREASNRGMLRGAIIGALDGLSGGIAGKQLAKAPLANLAIQSLVQAAMGGAGEAGAQLATDGRIDMRQVLVEALAEFTSSPLEVGGMAFSRLRQERAKAQDANRQKEILAEVSSQSGASKVRARSPDKFRQFVEQATANGPIENVYVNGDTFVEYFQSIGFDPFDFLDGLEGVTADDLRVATMSGGDIRIPTATYAAKIAGSEYDAFLLDNMKFDPDAMTASQAAEFNERSEVVSQEAWEQAEAARVEAEQYLSIEEHIYDSVVSRLRVAGQSTDVSTADATLYPAFYSAMAKRSGMTTSEFLGRYRLPEVKGSLPEGIQMRNVDELNRTLAEARNRKKVKESRSSLLEFISDYGGIHDPGGELRSRDAEIVRRGKGRKSLKLSRGGIDGRVIDMLGQAGGKKHGVDDVALAVIEAGYMADDPIVNEYRAAMEDGRENPDLSRALWDAIDRELRGETQYVADAEVEARSDQEAMLDDLEEYLSSLGVSLEDNDADIRQAIEGARQYAKTGDVTQTEAFKAWFGDSKVVDADGKPLVVYHGTDTEVGDDFAFSSDRVGVSSGDFGYFGKGHYFTDKKWSANNYANNARGGGNPSVIDAYISIKAPLVLDVLNRQLTEKTLARLERLGIPAPMRAWESDASASAWSEAVKSAGFDGVVSRIYAGEEFHGGVVSDNLALDPEYYAELETPPYVGDDGYLVIPEALVQFPEATMPVSDDFETEIVAFSPTQIKSVNNRGTFDPNDARLLFQDVGGPRGSIQISAGGVRNGDTVIRLFESANLSTFLHESGHFFLSVMQDMSRDGGPVADDFGVVKSWWRENAKAVAVDASKATGVDVTEADVQVAIDSGSTGKADVDSAIDIGMQEQFARGFEAYLMEGKAPSADLRGVFEKFRSWLISVYGKVSRLNVAISDEMRGVFDRMLASDAEIVKAQSDTGGNSPVFSTAEAMGLSQEDYTAFMNVRQQAEDEAKARLLRETMAPIKRAEEKKFKEQRVKVREAVEREVNSFPAFRAIEWMGNRRWIGDNQPEAMPDLRLSKDVLVDRYGEGVLKTLPRGKYTVYSAKGGLDPDDVSGWFGFDSGDEMVRAMEKAPNRKEAIEAETDRLMRELHGDPLNDGSVEAMALDAVHNDKKGDWIATEIKSIVEVSGVGVGLTAKEARASAKQTIAGMRVRDAIASQRFLAAERKAADEAASLGAQLAREKIWLDAAKRRIAKSARAAVRGEASPDATAAAVDGYNSRFETTTSTFAVAEQSRVSSAGNAYTIPAGERTSTKLGYNELVSKLVEAKRRQLINHALYSEARKVTAEVEAAERFVVKLGKKSTRDRIAGAGRRENAQIDYLGAIDEILMRYDFKKMSGAAEERRGALNAFVDAMTAIGRENEIAISEAVLTAANRKPYKMVPVEELRGVVDSLKNLEYVATRTNKLIDAAKERDLEASVDDIMVSFDENVKKAPPGRVGSTSESLRKAGRQFLDIVLNATTLLREIDGFKDMGAAYRNIKAPIDDAMVRLISRKEKAANDLEALYNVYSKDERRRMSVREHIPELGYALSKWEKIAVALNTGNEGNLQRLTDPKVNGHLNEDQVRVVVNSLDVKDADFIQSVWDYVGSFKSDIEAREKRTTGVAPKWVEGTPVIIAGKTLKGGYYPLKYDSRLSAFARDDETADLAKTLQSGRFGKAQTKSGHTKERAQSSGRAVELDMSVLHRHVNQVIYDLELSEPVSNSWRVLQDGRVRSAFLEAGKQADFDALEIWLQDVGNGELNAADIVSRGARMMKSNFTAAKLAFNMSTVLLQVTGLSQSAVIVGKRNMAVGIANMFSRDVNPIASVRAVSSEVAERSAFMKTRETTFNKDIYDFYSDAQSGATASRWNELKRGIIGPLSFWLMTKVQWYTADVPTWLAGYRQGMEKFGNDEAKAISHADDIVKRSQASGLFSDRSAVERGSLSKSTRQNAVVRSFTALGSYMFIKFNAAYERSMRASRTIKDEGASAASVKEALSYSLDMALLFTFEAVVMAALKGGLPGGDDDDEDDDGWIKFLAKQTALSVMGTVPFVRDGASAMQGFSGGGSYGGAMEDAFKGAVAIGNVATLPFSEDDELRKSDIKAIINATGLATGLPATQTNRFVDGLWRRSEGEEVAPLEYLLGKSKK